MNALRKLAVSLAITLASAPAMADENPLLNDGWNTRYGMIFSLQNVFTQNGILGNYDPDGGGTGIGGGIGLQFNLGPQSSLRFALDVARTSNPAFEAENTFRATDGTVVTTKSFVVPAGNTSTLDLGLSGSYLVRLTKSSLAPYVGAGASLSYGHDARAYEDDISVPNETETVDNMARTFAVGLMGQLGLEWRVHKSLSMFAEYGLGVTAFSQTSGDNSTKVTNAAGTTENASSFSQTRFFNFDSGLVQGGSLGIIAFF